MPGGMNVYYMCSPFQMTHDPHLATGRSQRTQATEQSLYPGTEFCTKCNHIMELQRELSLLLST